MNEQSEQKTGSARRTKSSGGALPKRQLRIATARSKSDNYEERKSDQKRVNGHLRPSARVRQPQVALSLTSSVLPSSCVLSMKKTIVSAVTLRKSPGHCRPDVRKNDHCLTSPAPERELDPQCLENAALTPSHDGEGKCTERTSLQFLLQVSEDSTMSDAKSLAQFAHNENLEDSGNSPPPLESVSASSHCLRMDELSEGIAAITDALVLSKKCPSIRDSVNCLLDCSDDDLEPINAKKLSKSTLSNSYFIQKDQDALVMNSVASGKVPLQSENKFPFATKEESESISEIDVEDRKISIRGSVRLLDLSDPTLTEQDSCVSKCCTQDSTELRDTSPLPEKNSDPKAIDIDSSEDGTSEINDEEQALILSAVALMEGHGETASTGIDKCLGKEISTPSLDLLELALIEQGSYVSKNCIQAITERELSLQGTSTIPDKSDPKLIDTDSSDDDSIEINEEEQALIHAAVALMDGHTEPAPANLDECPGNEMSVAAKDDSDRKVEAKTDVGGHVDNRLLLERDVTSKAVDRRRLLTRSVSDTHVFKKSSQRATQSNKHRHPKSPMRETKTKVSRHPNKRIIFNNMPASQQERCVVFSTCISVDDDIAMSKIYKKLSIRDSLIITSDCDSSLQEDTSLKDDNDRLEDIFLSMSDHLKESCPSFIRDSVVLPSYVGKTDSQTIRPRSKSENTILERPSWIPPGDLVAPKPGSENRTEYGLVSRQRKKAAIRCHRGLCSSEESSGGNIGRSAPSPERKEQKQRRRERHRKFREKREPRSRASKEEKHRRREHRNISAIGGTLSSSGGDGELETQISERRPEKLARRERRHHKSAEKTDLSCGDSVCSSSGDSGLTKRTSDSKAEKHRRRERRHKSTNNRSQ